MPRLGALGNIGELLANFKNKPSKASEAVYTRLAERIAQAPQGPEEYGLLKLPTVESELIKGTLEDVPFGKHPLFKEHLNEPFIVQANNPPKWPAWGTAHTHPRNLDESWQQYPPSFQDHSLFARLPLGGRHLIYHPQDQVLEAVHITDMPELQKLAKSRRKPVSALFNHDLYTKKMAYPPEMGSLETATSRALPLTLQSKGLIDVSNSGDDVSNAIFKQFAEDWAKKYGFAGGGLIKNALTRLAKKETEPAKKGIMSVVKEGGGNWLSGSVEGALGGLKRYADPHDIELMRKNLSEPHPDLAQADELEKVLANAKDVPVLNTIGREVVRLRDRGNQQRTYWQNDLNQLLRSQSLNNFVDKQLTKYVKNQMATPNDPIRALAERGVLHFTPETMPRYIADVQETREATGFPKAFGASPLAQKWEAYTDQMIRHKRLDEPVRKGSSVQMREVVAAEPSGAWAMTAPDKTPVYEYRRPGVSSAYSANEELGFNHLIDELSNAINPESGLPHHLQFPVDRLDRVSVPQAVERVAKINEWRAAMKAEADAMKANNAATTLFKEYPENNPLGLRWVELRAGEQANPAYEVKRVQGKNGEYWDVRKPGAPYGHTTYTEAEALRASNREALQDALKYEGDTMDHCVGGYCDDVLSGRSRIYSLRDAKGQPHVTIETRPPRSPYPSSGVEFVALPQSLKDEYRAIVDAWTKENPDSGLHGLERVHAALEAAGVPKQAGSIVQIKGKQNGAPNPEYLPFVQDFVQSQKWSDVGDLQNSGLRKVEFPNFGITGYHSKESLEQALRKAGVPDANISGHTYAAGFAKGGKVGALNCMRCK